MLIGKPATPDERKATNRRKATMRTHHRVCKMNPDGAVNRSNKAQVQKDRVRIIRERLSKSSTICSSLPPSSSSLLPPSLSSTQAPISSLSSSPTIPPTECSFSLSDPAILCQSSKPCSRPPFSEPTSASSTNESKLEMESSKLLKTSALSVDGLGVGILALATVGDFTIESKDEKQDSSKLVWDRRRRHPPRTDGLKQCSKCDKIQTLDQFNVRHRPSGGHYSQCKGCVHEDSRNIARRKGAIIKLWDKDKTCADCGESNQSTFEHDHLDGGHATSGSGRKIKIIVRNSIDEIAWQLRQTASVCARCHRKRTEGRCTADRVTITGSSRRKFVRARVKLTEICDAEKRKIGACQVCKFWDPDRMYLFDWDHREREEKTCCVSGMSWYSVEQIKAEIAKCDLLCVNCHRIRTRVQMGWPDWKLSDFSADELKTAQLHIDKAATYTVSPTSTRLRRAVVFPST